MAKTFFIIEDHALMRHGITGWISENSEWICIGTGSKQTESIEKLKKLENLPQIVVTDINLGNGSEDYSGLKLIQEISKTFDSIKCICYSMFKTPGIIQMALDCGAKGYVSKNAGEKELIECMEKVLAGETYVEQSLSPAVIAYNNEVASFTRRERSVLDLIVQHKTNEEIANILGVQKRAIETYTSRIYDKTGCNSRLELIEMFL